MRFPREYQPGDGGWYHVTNRVTGYPDNFFFSDKAVKDRFIAMLRKFSFSYCCRIAAYVIMDNHYHVVVYFEPQPDQRMSREELQSRARWLYGSKYDRYTRNWSDQQWERFEDRLYDLTAMMRDLDGGFAVWLNGYRKRTGRLWQDRYTSVHLTSMEAVQEEVLYVDLNAPRASLCQMPEQYAASTASVRYQGDEADSDRADFLIPLEEIFEQETAADAFQVYRRKLLLRGLKRTRPNQAELSAELVEAELQQMMEKEGNTVPEGFVQTEMERGIEPGIYLRSHAFLVHGVELGSRQQLEKSMARHKEVGHYKQQNKAPTAQLYGLYSLRRSRPNRFDIVPEDSEPKADRPAKVKTPPSKS